MTEERLKQLLIKCMNWIETDNYETLNTFENLGFKPDELKELGFKYLQNNNMEELSKDIAAQLESCGFDDITDSSGYFVIREFSDGTDRCVDVHKSTDDGKSHYVVYCSYEDESFDYKYTDDLTVEALEKVLDEVYESEVV